MGPFHGRSRHVVLLCELEPFHSLLISHQLREPDVKAKKPRFRLQGHLSHNGIVRFISNGAPDRKPLQQDRHDPKEHQRPLCPRHCVKDNLLGIREGDAQVEEDQAGHLNRLPESQELKDECVPFCRQARALEVGSRSRPQLDLLHFYIAKSRSTELQLSIDGRGDVILLHEHVGARPGEQNQNLSCILRQGGCQAERVMLEEIAHNNTCHQEEVG
mmetsp:Transcript_1474/g.3488  ORF Transcript_1474/g.3488 Transcript_1474/m.3488 type:complete len:216 (-) Transcript_1474:1076-1723(-)